MDGKAEKTEKRGIGLRWLMLMLLLLVIVLLALNLPTFAKKAELGSAYAAQIGCSCHYVEGRSMKSCAGDLEAAAWMVSMSADAEAKAVTGSVPLLARRTAHYHPQAGCTLDKED